MLMFRAILALALASSVSALAQRGAPLTVPDTFQPKHTSLSPNSLEIVESSYGKSEGSEPYRPLYFVNSTLPLWM